MQNPFNFVEVGGIINIGSDDGMVQSGITWANVDPDLYCHLPYGHHGANALGLLQSCTDPSIWVHNALHLTYNPLH